MAYRIKLLLQWLSGVGFKIAEMLRGNVVLASKIVGSARIRLGRNVYISDHVRLISERGGRIEIGNGSKIGTMSILEDRGGFIKIGHNTSINSFSVLYGHGGLTIGDNVIMATHVTLVPANHNFSDPHKLIIEQGESKKGITIGNNVWLAANVTILDGVTIGEGSVIGAGSVVTKDILPNSIAVGAPAKIIRNRN